MSPVQRIDVDGVPVFTSPGPQRVIAALVFGVGIRDESYATLGVTHLIEHLVMGALPKSHLDCNAMVDVETTIFHATGRPAAVADFLAGVCAAVSDLPTDRLDLEVGVLQAENCAGSHPTAAALWAARFRLTGPGVAYAGGGTPEWLTEEAVRAHARRFFVRGNAALAWHGERREDLRLLLPEGFRPERSGYEVRPQSGPVWLQGPTGGVGLLLSATRPFPSELDVGVAVLQERMRDIARHERGLSYSTELQVVDVAADHSETALLVDAREGQNAAVAGVLWEQYLDLCRTGPSPAELAHAVAGFEAALDDEQEATAGALGRAAFCAVSGLPFRGPATRSPPGGR